MAIIKCKMCGGDIELSADKTFGTCDSCGSTMTLPKIDDDQRAAQFNRGNHFRRSGEFDKALAVYERIVTEDDSDAEAHWCCALCRFGIEYVEDPNTYEFIPTCHRASFDSFLEDVDYLAALEHSDGVTKRQYMKDAAKIAEVQRGILATSQNEEPFDVFICYKETAEDGQRTKDSTLAQDIYYQLTEAGYRVFFSRITLEDKAGTEYEPYIFAALNSAKIMVAVGTKPEYFNAVWVKNEWSRFLAMMRRDRSKLLLPCYRDMDPYDLPEQLSVLQSYDMSKIGFMQDLLRGIKKVLTKDEPKPEPVKETVIVQRQENGSGPNATAMLKRGFMALEDGEWDKANGFFEEVLNMDAECAEAYLGLLMIELKVGKRENLKNCAQPFDGSKNYQKALRFADKTLAEELEGDVAYINERNENARLTGIYNDAKNAMNAADNEATYKSAAAKFATAPGFKDADDLAAQCLEKAENCRKDAAYGVAIDLAEKRYVAYIERAIEIFGSISGWRDADEQIDLCQEKIEKLKVENEKAARAEKLKKEKVRKIGIICGLAAVIAIAAVIVITTVIIPGNKYKAAAELMDAGQYEEAIAAFEAMDGYKDSVAQIENCKIALKDIDYNAAISLMDAGKYEEAIAAFEALDGYKDSAVQINNCKTALKDIDYNAAVSLLNDGKIIDAYESLIALNGYKDSAAKASEIFGQYKIEKLKIAEVGDIVYFGAYEQDNNTSNGKEDVEWIALAKENEKVLVISKYALDCQKYNSAYTNVTWEKCSLRTWMNGTFLNNAFSTDEQAKIATTIVSADKNPVYSTKPGNATTDKVFLLSITEAEKYFTSDSARQCKPTKYAIANGAYVNSGNGNCWWWLRSPGGDHYRAAPVSIDGSVSFSGYLVDDVSDCVRPALWINLE